MRIFGRSMATGRRRVPRSQAPLQVSLSTAAAECAALLVDISRTGARVRGPLLPTVGEQLSFYADGINAFGQVVRCEGDECAIEFATPIGVIEVQHIRRVGGLDD